MYRYFCNFRWRQIFKILLPHHIRCQRMEGKYIDLRAQLLWFISQQTSVNWTNKLLMTSALLFPYVKIGNNKTTFINLHEMLFGGSNVLITKSYLEQYLIHKYLINVRYY